MGRGYWLPPNCENLLDYEGFYVSLDALNIQDTESCWNTFLEQVSNKLQHKENSLKIKKEWKTVDGRQRRFVILSDNCVEIVADESDEYYAIYVLIPEDCIVPNLAKQCFCKYKSDLRSTLIELYPGNVKQRKNYRQLVDIG